MAGKPNGMILYGHHEAQVNMLTDEEAGKLLKALYKYFNSGEIENLPITSALVFSMFKNEIDHDNDKYVEVCKKRSEAIKSRWNKANTSEDNSIQMNTNEYNCMISNTNDTNKNTNKNINTNTNKNKIFHKPTVDEIKEYCIERHNSVDAERFFDFYESKGWKVGKNPMKDWKASVRTWERSTKAEQQEEVYRELGEDELPF